MAEETQSTGGEGLGSSSNAIKLPVLAATTAALAANTATTTTLTANANGAIAAVDGVTLILNDRLLVKNEVTQANNGIYKVTQVGTAGTPYILTRTTDFDQSAEVVAGMLVVVTTGTTLADTIWELSANAPITVGTTSLTFIRVSAAIDGSGTANEITYWVDVDTVGALAVATYPSLTELSYVKGVTSAVQTQLNTKFAQSGNTFGANARLGTNDAFNLEFETNNTLWGAISSTGLWAIGGPLATATQLAVTQNVLTTGSPVAFLVVGGAHTTLTASTESIGAQFNFSATKQYATGALTTQREFLIQAPAYGFVGGSTVTTAATMAITGAPQSQTNATITDSYGILVQAGAVQPAGSVTRSYGLSVNAQTGATNNYAANFLGGFVGMGIAVPTARLHVQGSSDTAASTALLISNSTPTTMLTVSNTGRFAFTQIAEQSAIPTFLSFTSAAHTTITASTEDIGVNFNLSATKQWATGALTTQREILFQAPTYGFVGASTITNAATLAISAAPIAGTNATITNSYALWVQSGQTRLVGSGTGATTYGLQVHNSSGTNNALIVDDAGKTGFGSSDFTGISPRVLMQGTTTDGSTQILVGQGSGASNVFSLRTDGSAGFSKSMSVGILSSPVYAGDKLYLSGSDTSRITAYLENTDGVAWLLNSRGTLATNPSSFDIFRSGASAPYFVIDDAAGFIGIGITIPLAMVDIAQAVSTSGSPTALRVVGGAHTTLAASAESVGVNFNFSATKQYATGALATQREILFQAPTYGFVGASTLTSAATVAISGAPIAGTNATITNSYALWVQAGALRADGRVLKNQGADVASVAGAMALGSDGNTFEITGTNAITLISNLGWQNGSEINLLFTSTATLASGTATSGTDITLLLEGGVTFVGKAGARIALTLNEIGGAQAWREQSRSYPTEAGIDTTAGDAATINSLAGRFRKDTSGTTFTLTNSYIVGNSIIVLTTVTAGITTGNQLSVVAGTGSAVITFETAGVAAAPSANMDVNFMIIN